MLGGLAGAQRRRGVEIVESPKQVHHVLLVQIAKELVEAGPSNAQQGSTSRFARRDEV